ncbi:MAG TPA: GNAT family N-acetyltransferase [Longimicrobium sp.]
MSIDAISLDDVAVRRLDGPPDTGFDCGHQDQNLFLYGRAWEDQEEGISVTYLYYVHGILAGFVTVCMDSLLLSRRERGVRVRYETIGAVKIAQVGVDESFQSRRLGRRIVADAIVLAQLLGEIVGCRYVILDARLDVVRWYENLGFKHNTAMQEHRVERALKMKRDPDRLAKSMRFDIRAVG